MNDQSADGRELTSAALAQMIDISAVQAFHGEADIRALAEIATRHGFIAAHALPHFVPLLRSLVPRGGATLVGGPVGFPSGGHTTETKVLEARRLARDGAEELDMVINLGRLKSGDLSYVREEVVAVVQAVAPLPLKLILEITYLSDDELKRGCEIAVEAGAAFVKTGTGWTGEPTTVERVRTIAGVVDGAIGIKASGGIRSLETIAAMVALGVTRFGVNTRAAVALVAECAALPGGVLPRAAHR